MFSLSQGLNVIGLGLAGDLGAVVAAAVEDSSVPSWSNVSSSNVSPSGGYSTEWLGEDDGYSPSQIMRDYAEGAVQLARRKQRPFRRRHGPRALTPAAAFADALAAATIADGAASAPRVTLTKIFARCATGLLAGYALHKMGASAGAAAVVTGAAAAAIVPDGWSWALVSAGSAYAGAKI